MRPTLEHRDRRLAAARTDLEHATTGAQPALLDQNVPQAVRIIGPCLVVVGDLVEDACQLGRAMQHLRLVLGAGHSRTVTRTGQAAEAMRSRAPSALRVPAK